MDSLNKKYVVCFSGGEASALCAIETVRKYGKENVILLNHDISPEVEHEDIKRFKKEVSEYLGIPISYANANGWEELTPIRACLKQGAFQSEVGRNFCTYLLKTKPFYEWLKEYFPSTPGKVREDVVILYGFDKTEQYRITRRVDHLFSLGYRADFPLAFWERTISSIEEIGIKKPITYRIFHHANCIGCLKAGKRHWYAVYCLRPDIFKEAMEAEEEIGYSIIKNVYLQDLVETFEMLKSKGVCPNELGNYQEFWAMVNSIIPEEVSLFPCDCALL